MYRMTLIVNYFLTLNHILTNRDRTVKPLLRSISHKMQNRKIPVFGFYCFKELKSLNAIG